MSIDTTTPDTTPVVHLLDAEGYIVDANGNHILSEKGKKRKPRAPRVEKEPGTVPATISFGKHVISAEKADQFRARLSSEWDSHVAECFTAYQNTEKSKGLSPKGKRDWRKSFTLEAKDFFQDWKSKRLTAVIEWYDNYAEQAQSMVFEKKKEPNASVRNTLALSAARLSQVAYMVSFSSMKVALATLSATPETRSEVSRASREAELASMVEQLNSIFGAEFGETDFSGVISRAIENLSQQTASLPTVMDDLDYLILGSRLDRQEVEVDPDSDDDEPPIDVELDDDAQSGAAFTE